MNSLQRSVTRKVSGLSPTCPCSAFTTNRVAAVVVGAFIFGAGFVFMRLVDLKVKTGPKWETYLHMTTWIHILVSVYFLVVGFTKWNPKTLTATIGYMCTFMLIMRLLYFEYDMTNFFSTYKELFAHILVPVAFLAWIASRQVAFKVTDNGWRWKSVLVLFGIVGVWFVINCVIRHKRGVWIYGEHAADPGTPKGRIQTAIGVIILAICIGFVQLIVTQSCV